MLVSLTGAAGFLGSHVARVLAEQRTDLRLHCDCSCASQCRGVYTEMGMQFEWDPRKDISNQRKHVVGFREATTVFGDPFATTFPDAEHSADEQRFLTIGASAMGRLLVVAHAERNATIRIISARPATPRERRFYEEEQ